jgi:lipopolysaccharide export system protein LptA
MLPATVRLRILLAVMLLAPLFVAGAARGWAQPIGPTSQPVTLEHADNFVGSVENGENVIDMNGHVVIIQGVVKIEADHARLYEGRNYAVMTGNVRVTQPEMVMTAPRAEYNGATKLATAPNGLTIVDNGATVRAGSGEYNMYDRVAHFRDGVTLKDEKSTLRAASGDYYSVERRAEFRGGVRVDNDSGSITARDLKYWRDSRQAFATGDVVVISKQHSARLTGDTVDHRPGQGYTVATGSPKLVQIDTARASDSTGKIRRDTTIITAMKLEAYRTGREEYVATDSVRMVRGELEGVAALARFLPKDNVIALGPGRRVEIADTAAVDTSSKPKPGPGVKPDTSAAGNPVAGVRARPVGPYPVVWFQKSQLTGDTITVGLEKKRVRTIDVMGNAFAVSEGSLAGRYDQLAAVRLLFDIVLDTIRTVRGDGQASSIYYVFDGKEPSGVNRASGDTIVINFDRGAASRIAIYGKRSRAEGEYFPEELVAGQETVFRLDGFRLIPRDRKLAALDGSLPPPPVIPEVRPPDIGPVTSAPRNR